MVKPSRRGPMVERLVDSYLVSERRACRTELRMRIREIAQARVRYGYRKIRVLLNREGWDVGKYLVYRLYSEEGLTLKRMKPAGKRKASLTREDRIKPTGPNEAWSIDFVMDQLQNGARFRALAIVDVHTWCCCQSRQVRAQLPESGAHRGRSGLLPEDQRISQWPA